MPFWICLQIKSHFFFDPLGRLQPDTECGRGRTGLYEPPLVPGVSGPSVLMPGGSRDQSNDDNKATRH